MLTIDLTANSGNLPRWNINNFINSSRKREIYVGTKNIPKEDVAELDKVIRTIDVEYNRISSELDRQSKDLTTIETQLKKRIDAFNKMGEPGEIEIQYRKMALDIVIARTKISMEKAKLYESKVKQIREERKLMYDKNKDNATIVTDSNSNSTSPVAIANSIENVGMNNLGVTVPNHILANLALRNNQHNNISNNNIVPEVKKEDVVLNSNKEGDASSSTFQVEKEIKPNVSTNSVINKNKVNNSDIVINPNNLNVKTTETVSVGDQYERNLELIKAREACKNVLLNNQEGIMGSKLVTSLNSLISNTQNIKEVLYVDKNTGRYWIKGYEVLDNGEMRESPNYNPKSVMHIGKVRFDVKNQLVKTTHYDDSIHYELSNDSSMGDFYEKEWNKESSKQYILEDSVLELL